MTTELHHLTPEQLIALRAVPLVGGMRNKLRIAIALSEASQTDLADATGLARHTVSKLVNGIVVNTSVDTARRVADFFGCAIEDLFPAQEAVAS